MSFFRASVMCALSVGALLLSSGCTGRKEVALAAKDDTIKRQDEIHAQDSAEKEKLATLNSEIAAQNTQLAEKNAQLATQQLAKTAELEAIVRELGAKVAAGGNEAGVSRDDKGAIHITVAGMALFEPGKAELRSGSTDVLRRVVQVLKSKYPNNFVRIEGHTDSTPIVHSKEKYPDNMALSVARAQAVYSYLISKGGISAGKLYTAGYGSSQPLVHPEKTAADRSKNRRVEIVIMPSDVKVQKEPLAMAKSSKSTTGARK